MNRRRLLIAAAVVGAVTLATCWWLTYTLKEL